MPNHTANNFSVHGPKDDVLRFVAQAKGEDRELDFNRLVPMPEELRGTSSPVRIQTQEEIDKTWVDWRKAKEAKADSGPMGLHSFEQERPFGLGITQAKYDELMAKYGCADWYEWAICNWGTKWNCYGVTEWSFNEIDKDTLCATIYYETAWSPVSLLFLKVSKDYPTLEFFHEFADEGGAFLGSEVILNGQVISEEELDWDSDDGITLREGLGRYFPEDDEETVS
jgi:hypothetical protein|tara:strand:- start:3052 stop:3729 length:678 start_codon:yes stop_codon:yes gene_type:complete